MKLKIIACKVFEHEITFCAAACPNRLEIEFIDLGEHVHPALLREKLQGRIDVIATEPPQYDAVLLAYGLCGRAVDGIVARREPLILPRSHDCGGILLGSRKKFEEYFSAMPSTPFSSIGYAEHGNYFFQDESMVSGNDFHKLIEKYGEDNAKYIYESMHPSLNGELQPICFIETPELRIPELREKCRRKAEAEGRGFRLLHGSLRLILMLLNGDWPDNEFLTVKPARKIKMTGDWDRIVTTD